MDFDYAAVCESKDNLSLVRALAVYAQAIPSKSPLWHMPSERPSEWVEIIPMEAFKAAETELLKRLGEPAPVYEAVVHSAKRARRR